MHTHSRQFPVHLALMTFITSSACDTVEPDDVYSAGLQIVDVEAQFPDLVQAMDRRTTAARRAAHGDAGHHSPRRSDLGVRAAA